MPKNFSAYVSFVTRTIKAVLVVDLVTNLYISLSELRYPKPLFTVHRPVELRIGCTLHEFL